jgi:hypothetical protein
MSVIARKKPRFKWEIGRVSTKYTYGIPFKAKHPRSQCVIVPSSIGIESAPRTGFRLVKPSDFML